MRTIEELLKLLQETVLPQTDTAAAARKKITQTTILRTEYALLSAYAIDWYPIQLYNGEMQPIDWPLQNAMYLPVNDGNTPVLWETCSYGDITNVTLRAWFREPDTNLWHNGTGRYRASLEIAVWSSTVALCHCLAAANMQAALRWRVQLVAVDMSVSEYVLK